MNKKRCKALLGLVQLLPAVAAAAAVLFALPRTVPVLAAVPERLTTVVEQPVEAASSEAEEAALPKLPYADGVYVGSSRATAVPSGCRSPWKTAASRRWRFWTHPTRPGSFYGAPSGRRSHRCSRGRTGKGGRMMEKTQTKPLTAAQQRQRDKKHRTWLRAGVQLFFFLLSCWLGFCRFI